MLWFYLNYSTCMSNPLPQQLVFYIFCIPHLRHLPHLVVSVLRYQHRVLLSVLYFYFILECVLIWSVYVTIFQLYLSYFDNKSNALAQGHTKIPGGECYKLEIWAMENITGFLCIAEENSQQGCTGGGADKLQAIPLYMCSAFPTEMGEQMILMSFSDVIITLLMHLEIWYKRKACKNLGAVILVSGTEGLGQLLGGHQPSTLAVSQCLS